MRPTHPALAACALVAAIGCAGPGAQDEVIGPSPEAPPQSLSPVRGEEQAWPSPAVLYSRDGTPVATDGLAAPGAAPAHDVRPSEGGRMYILELYQGVLEERDALALELASLQRELDRERQARAQAETRNAGLEREIAGLKAEGERLVAENLDLAARLTTAQIRRLQAEKVLLELRIEQERAAAAAAATAAATAEPPPAEKQP